MVPTQFLPILTVTPWDKQARTRGSGRNSLFLRIFLNISVSSSLASSPPASELGPAAASAEDAAASAVVSGGVWPGSGASTVGSSACSINHSMACVTDILKSKSRHRDEEHSRGTVACHRYWPLHLFPWLMDLQVYDWQVINNKSFGANLRAP